MFCIFDRIVSMADDVCRSTSLPNEYLYGRAGYLYTLLYIQDEIGEGAIKADVIIKVNCFAV